MRTSELDWTAEFPASITVSGKDGTILSMNDRAAKTFEAQGGRALVGGDLMACHNERSKGIIRHLMETGETNVYTIEKKGIKKLIYQSPWFQDGELAGLVEISFQIPAELPHYKRD